MGTLIDTLEVSGGASAIWNEFEIRVTPGQWEVWENEATGAVQSGWSVDVKDFLADGDETLHRGMRTEIVREHHVTIWEDLVGVLAELGVPDEFDGWR